MRSPRRRRVGKGAALCSRRRPGGRDFRCSLRRARTLGRRLWARAPRAAPRAAFPGALRPSSRKLGPRRGQRWPLPRRPRVPMAAEGQVSGGSPGGVRQAVAGEGRLVPRQRSRRLVRCAGRPRAAAGRRSGGGVLRAGRGCPRPWALGSVAVLGRMGLWLPSVGHSGNATCRSGVGASRELPVGELARSCWGVELSGAAEPSYVPDWHEGKWRALGPGSWA